MADETQDAPVPKKWDKVASDPKFKRLTPDQQAHVREQYFDQVIAPTMHGAWSGEAKEIWMKGYLPTSIKKAVTDEDLNPTTGMSPLQRARAGAGKAFSDIGQGIGQAVGAVSPEDVADTRKRDAPLMATPSGMAGNLVGNVAAMAPTALIPGANTVAGASAIGAGVGALQPSTSMGETIQNALTGGGMAAGVTGGMRALPALKGAFISPFTERGQESMALSAINRFARDKGAIRGADTSELVPGSKPSLAEVTKDPGIAQLQRGAQAKSPEVANLFAEQKTTRLQARKDALLSIAGDDAEKAYFEAARDTTAKRLYGEAFKTPVDPKNVKAVAPDIQDLLRRPAIQQARAEAIKLAKNEGEDLTKGDLGGSIKGLHYMKKAIDDQIKAAIPGSNQQRVLLGVQDKLVGVMQKLSPKYATAMAEYQAASKPISRMEIGRYLYEKLVPAASDVGAERLTPQPFIKALRDGDKMAQQATGFKGAKLQDILSTEDMNKVIGLAKDLGNEIAATEMAKVPGSPTAQYLAAGNAMRQVLGPLGLPQSWIEKTIGQTFASWGSKFPFNVAEGQIQQKLGEMLTNPDLAKRAALNEKLKMPLSDIAKRLLPPVATGIGSYEAER